MWFFLSAFVFPDFVTPDRAGQNRADADVAAATTRAGTWAGMRERRAGRWSRRGVRSSAQRGDWPPASCFEKLFSS
ncbi:hypothetical protein C5E05_14670 [Pseudoclavibacter sp. AY1H1]|nr:hypothetical protein C5E05_14670 [Pseudoclavibacter sp. AY1H1]